MVAGSSRSVGEVSDGVIVVLYIVIGPAAGDIAYGFLGIPPERLAPVSDDGLKSFDSLAAIFVELLVEVFHYLRLPQRPLCAAFLLCLPPRLGFISSSTNYVPHRSKYGRELVNVVQRGSDAVRIGFTDIDDDGFNLRQEKTGREVWCPIVPELAAEIATWERRPGPFLLQASGKRYTRKLFWEHFDKARVNIPELADVTLHGPRATATIRLRRAGLSVPQIGDITGMSLKTIERYCRFRPVVRPP
jgi:hypothetical protein